MNYSVSNYNILVEKDKLNLLFNTRTLALMELDEQEITIFKYKNYDVNNLDDQLKSELYENGFIIADNVREIDILKREYWDNKINSPILFLTIMTTQNCNFKCTYCFEQQKNLKMGVDVQEKVIKFIKNNLSEYDAVHIDWYGGEPLLNLDCIKNVTQRVIDMCNKNNKIYLGSITTNGYNMSPEVINQLVELKIKSAQITIDGPKEIHDKRRILNNGLGTFDKIIENIQHAKDKMKISVRVNADINTIDSVEVLVDYLYKNGLSDIAFSVVSVISADTNPCYEVEIPQNLLAEKLIKIYNKALAYGFELPSVSFMSNLQRHFCIVDLNSQFIISPTGDIFKCGEAYDDSDPGKIGYIDNNGNPNIDIYKHVSWDKDPFEDEDCVNCNALPLCMGGCYMKKKIKNKDWCRLEFRYQLDEMICLYHKSITV